VLRDAPTLDPGKIDQWRGDEPEWQGCAKHRAAPCGRHKKQHDQTTEQEREFSAEERTLGYWGRVRLSHARNIPVAIDTVSGETADGGRGSRR